LAVAQALEGSETLSGFELVNFAISSLRNSTGLRNSLFRENKTMAPSGGSKDGTNRIWARIGLSQIKKEQSGQISGYTFKPKMVNLGYDQLFDSWMVGAGLGFMEGLSKTNNDYSQIEATAFNLALYAAFKAQPWNFSARPTLRPGRK
jgi:outer membrane autotransporter protein